MAYTYERKDSPWIWICFLDAGGVRRRCSTEIRKGMPESNRQARRLEAEYTLKENELPRVRSKEDAWENWVPDYLARRYQKSATTLIRAKCAWAPLSLYFEQEGIRAPRGLDYMKASKFMEWRQSARTGLRVVSHNTARTEITFLRVIMAEAVRRGYTATNPCRELEISRAPVKKKREITAQEQVTIERALLKKPAWMQESWKIYMLQGCRLSEVEIPLEPALRRIEENAKPPLITFRLKGGRLHTTALHPELVPFVRCARAEGREVLVRPAKGASKIWTDFFEEIGLAGLSIHCTRVTVISRLVRQGEDSVRVRQFIGHTSDSIQAVYRRLKPSDVSSVTRHLGGQQNTS